ncbi:hypothetical protein ACWCQ0_45885, partial [Streptomyces massasporeus]
MDLRRLLREYRRGTSRSPGRAQIDGAPVASPAPAGNATDSAVSLDPIAIRVWDPSPEHHLEADYPVVASLSELEALLLLGAAVRAITHGVQRARPPGHLPGVG